MLPSPSTIHISGGGERFFLAVRPAPDDLPTLAQYPTHAEALAKARLLRLEHGWAIQDSCSGAKRSGKAA
jgi:hypothetical protein